jgi:cytochrome P450
VLRFEGPLQIGNRRATRDAEIGGVPVPAGTYLHLVIAAANRDPRQFRGPETLDITREPNRHLAFAHGIHTCAGNSVARIEAAIAFTKLLERFPNFRRADPTVRPHRSRFRVVERLEIELSSPR